MRDRKLTVYVASALENWATVKVIQNELRALGMEVPHDWAAIYERELKEEGYQPPTDLARTQIRTVASVDCLMLVVPGKRGAHVEYGVALGVGVPTVVLLGGGVRSIGFYKLADLVTESVNEAIKGAFRLAKELGERGRG